MITQRRARLVELLSKKGMGYSIPEMMEELNASQRSVYREIENLQQSGYVFEKDRDGHFRIAGYRPGMKQGFELKFTPKEFALFKMLLQGIVEERPNGGDMQDRLAMVYRVSSRQMVEMDVRYRRYIMNVKALNRAISGKRVVELRDYESGQSNRRKNYQGEPYGFTNNLGEVLLYSYADRNCISMKIARIGDVVVTDRNWSREDRHLERPIDLFRMSGERESRVHLRLSLMAKNLLIEEVPCSEGCLRQEGDVYHFETTVYSMKGIGRFVIGLADQVDIVEGDELREYVGEFRRHLDRLAGRRNDAADV